MWENGLVRTKRQFVDLAIVESETPVLLIEIESNRDPEATIKKLSTGLMSQILYLRKRGNYVLEMKGFCIPVNPGFVEKVMGKFEENNLRFSFHRRPLTYEQVEESIVNVWRQQKDMLPFNEMSSLITLPLDPSPIQGKFDDCCL